MNFEPSVVKDEFVAADQLCSLLDQRAYRRET
jgi:hypothetical protein